MMVLTIALFTAFIGLAGFRNHEVGSMSREGVIYL